LDDNKNITLELQFYTILSGNPQLIAGNPRPILLGIIIAVLLIESMGKPTGLKRTGGLRWIKLFS
jgi:hypothetical protein